MERLLYETLVRPEIVEAEKSKLPPGVIMQIKAKVGHAGRVTNNGRLYGRGLLERELKAIKQSVAEREVEGLAGHPNAVLGGLPDPKDASYVVTGLTMEEDGSVVMAADVEDTAAGRDLAARCRAGVKVGFSSRGTGSAKKVTLTDKHPAYAENVGWQGKEVEEVGEDFRLRSFDHVIGQAVGDAQLRAYHEQEEGSMDMTKWSQADWDAVLKSEQVTKAIEKAVSEAQAKFDADMKAEVMKEVKAYLTSEQFVNDHFEVDDAEPPAQPVDEAAGAAGKIKCKACGASIPKGSKFCPECGEDPTVNPDEAEQQEEAQRARDDKVAALEKQIADMKAEKDAREEADALSKALAESCKGKAAVITEAVAQDARAAKVASKDAAEYAKGRIAFYEQLLAKGGGAPVPGTVPVPAQDDQAAKAAAEAAKNEGSLVSDDMVEMAR